MTSTTENDDVTRLNTKKRVTSAQVSEAGEASGTRGLSIRCHGYRGEKTGKNQDPQGRHQYQRSGSHIVGFHRELGGTDGSELWSLASAEDNQPAYTKVYQDCVIAKGLVLAL